MRRKAGQRFKRERAYIFMWLIHVDIWQKPTQYGKAIIPQLKINYKATPPTKLLLPVLFEVLVHVLPIKALQF